PVVDAVNVDSGGKNIRVPRQPHRRQKAAVGSAPQAYPVAIDIASSPQITTRRHDVLVLGRPTRAAVFSFSKSAAVSDPAPVVDRQHYKTSAHQILIQSIGVVIVKAVVPSQQHLPNRPTVHEHHCRSLS